MVHGFGVNAAIFEAQTGMSSAAVLEVAAFFTSMIFPFLSFWS